MATVDNGGEILQDTSGRCYAFCQTHAAEVLKDRLIQRVL